ncbi:MAG: C25 family cysteine peptidase [Anaerolineae bacterium]
MPTDRTDLLAMPPTASDPLADTRAALDDLAVGLAPRTTPRLASVITTSRRNLERKYGASAFQAIHQALQDLAHVTSSRLVCADTPAENRPVGLEPVRDGASADEWLNYVRRLPMDTRSLLFIGGPDIVPFQPVANPSDDDDDTLFSDAPYGGPALLSPGRAIGRLPDSADNDPSFLISLIRSTADARRAAGRQSKWATVAPAAGPAAVGYTASVWRHAARAVFSVIDTPKNLRMSPPLDHVHAPAIHGDRFGVAYFNLHGLKDDAGWYGQRDPLLAADYAAFPLALHPDALNADQRRRLVVFSAACYGGYISDKRAAESMALRLLQTKAAAFVGSTALAYGGLSETLLAADLLAIHFWRSVLGGLSVGEALRRAKIDMANDLIQRQGFLDAEDQKAILTFTLYGDPTLAPFAVSRAPWHAAKKGSEKAEAKTPSHALEPVSDAVVAPTAKAMGYGRAKASSGDMVARIEQQIRRQLPDLGQVEVKLVTPSVAKGVSAAPASATVTVAEAPSERPFRQLVKATLAPDGSILKLVMAHG